MDALCLNLPYSWQEHFTHFSPYRLRGAFGDQCFIEISLSADEDPLHGYPQTEYDHPAHE